MLHCVQFTEIQRRSKNFQIVVVGSNYRLLPAILHFREILSD